MTTSDRYQRIYEVVRRRLHRSLHAPGAHQDAAGALGDTEIVLEADERQDLERVGDEAHRAPQALTRRQRAVDEAALVLRRGGLEEHPHPIG
jgi:hypothetical protein